MTEGQRVLLVEDLATNGGSKFSFVDAIRETGTNCSRAVEIFNYGIFLEAEERQAKQEVQLHRLCTWLDVLDVARAEGTFVSETLEEVEEFLAAQREWQQARTGS